ncbi:hypothetical protein NST17_20270 [Caldifermentibacillus hisashii]|uniref:Uncharacterized protein n=1 Tax=Caldifermentibacillus hisashii TaxID=996558 RepID=A0ABU9K634_9BACI
MEKVLITKEQAEAIENLKLGFSKRIILVCKDKLDPRLKGMDDWDLARALIEGYETAENIALHVSF